MDIHTIQRRLRRSRHNITNSQSNSALINANELPLAPTTDTSTHTSPSSLNTTTSSAAFSQHAKQVAKEPSSDGSAADSSQHNQLLFLQSPVAAASAGSMSSEAALASSASANEAARLVDESPSKGSSLSGLYVQLLKTDLKFSRKLLASPSYRSRDAAFASTNQPSNNHVREVATDRKANVAAPNVEDAASSTARRPLKLRSAWKSVSPPIMKSRRSADVTNSASSKIKKKALATVNSESVLSSSSGVRVDHQLQEAISPFVYTTHHSLHSSPPPATSVLLNNGDGECNHGVSGQMQAKQGVCLYCINDNIRSHLSSVKRLSPTRSTHQYRDHYKQEGRADQISHQDFLMFIANKYDVASKQHDLRATQSLTAAGVTQDASALRAASRTPTTSPPVRPTMQPALTPNDLPMTPVRKERTPLPNFLNFSPFASPSKSPSVTACSDPGQGLVQFQQVVRRSLLDIQTSSPSPSLFSDHTKQSVSLATESSLSMSPSRYTSLLDSRLLSPDPSPSSPYSFSSSSLINQINVFVETLQLDGQNDDKSLQVSRTMSDYSQHQAVTQPAASANTTANTSRSLFPSSTLPENSPTDLLSSAGTLSGSLATNTSNEQVSAARSEPSLDDIAIFDTSEAEFDVQLAEPLASQHDTEHASTANFLSTSALTQISRFETLLSDEISPQESPPPEGAHSEQSTTPVERSDGTGTNGGGLSQGISSISTSSTANSQSNSPSSSVVSLSPNQSITSQSSLATDASELSHCANCHCNASLLSAASVTSSASSSRLGSDQRSRHYHAWQQQLTERERAVEQIESHAQKQSASLLAKASSKLEAAKRKFVLLKKAQSQLTERERMVRTKEQEFAQRESALKTEQNDVERQKRLLAMKLAADQAANMDVQTRTSNVNQRERALDNKHKQIQLFAEQLRTLSNQLAEKEATLMVELARLSHIEREYERTGGDHIRAELAAQRKQLQHEIQLAQTHLQKREAAVKQAQAWCVDEMSRVYVELDRKNDELRSVRAQCDEERHANERERRALQQWSSELEKQRTELAAYHHELQGREQKLLAFFPATEIHSEATN